MIFYSDPIRYIFVKKLSPFILRSCIPEGMWNDRYQNYHEITSWNRRSYGEHNVDGEKLTLFQRKTRVNAADQQIQKDESENAENDVKNGDIEKKVEDFSSAVAPILLPLIDSLGDLNVNEGYTSDTSGEET